MVQKNVVICGAGIAGISTAYNLAVHHGVKDILLVDERPPMSLTSDKSTECYRNWWPGPGNAMVSIMNRSIDLLENLADSTNNSFHLNRRGYLFLTGDPGKIPSMLTKAREISDLGAGPLRIFKGDSNDPHYLPSGTKGYSRSLDGADLILDRKLLHREYPYLTGNSVAGLHIRRAGWFSAQQLGSILLDKARKHGVQLINERVIGIDIDHGRISRVLLEGEKVNTKHFVNAAGPFINQVTETIDIRLPVYCELHLKVSTADHLKIIPREAPMLIWNDAQKLPWSDEESSFLASDPDSRWLLEEFPAGVHTRPEGGEDSPIILMLWEYQTLEVEPKFPPPLDDDYPEITLRGLTTMVPDLKDYFEKPPRPFLDGGFYTKTRENRPLICPLPIEGMWIIGALSGFGLMASLAAGELLTLQLLEKSLPSYAPAFDLKRYDNPKYIDQLSKWEDTGQI
jgi:glycine/D-amino acid oxidase-like deaminating enzyme